MAIAKFKDRIIKDGSKDQDAELLSQNDLNINDYKNENVGKFVE